MNNILKYGIVSQGSSSTITVDFGDSITTTSNTATDWDAYRSVEIVGRQASDTITLTMDYDVTLVNDGEVDILWSKNSTSSWTRLIKPLSSGSGSLNMTGISSTDTIRVRVHLTLVNQASDSASCYLELTGGSFTAGSGTITASGTTTWDTELLSS